MYERGDVMPVISRLPVIGGSGGIKLNVFTQMDEPEIKDGIWIQTDKKFSKIVAEDSVLNEDEASWTNLGTLPDYMNRNSQMINVNGVLYLSTGEDGTGYPDTSIYKFENGSFTPDTPKPVARKFIMTCFENSNIIFGLTRCYDASYERSYIYDGETWTQKNNIGFACTSVIDAGCSLFTYNNSLVYFDTNKINYFRNTKKSDGAISTSIEYFKVGEALEMSHSVYNGGAFVYNGNICAIHAKTFNDKSSPLISRFGENGWEVICDPPHSTLNRFPALCCVYNGSIHMLGCPSDSSYSTDHYKFDGEVWTKLQNLPLEILYGACIEFDNSLYVASNYSMYKLSSPTKTYDPYTVIIKRNRSTGGKYLTSFTNTATNITGNRNEMQSYFDDVRYYTSSGIDDTLPMYYGDGTQWIIFKN